NTKEMDFDGEKRMCYMDSSHENLGAIHDDVCRRRRDLGFSESDLTLIFQHLCMMSAPFL
ncbi:hypothetical protein OSTOST_19606, partial [Ostertagia ostertagi]